MDGQDFAAVGEGQLPTGEPSREWSFGDVDAGFASREVVLDETFVTAGLSHHSMEPRCALAYWENGKCILHGSTQSQSFLVPGIARMHRHRAGGSRLTSPSSAAAVSARRAATIR